MKKHVIISRKFMIFLPYLLFSSLLLTYGVDKYRFKGPKYQAPETAEAVWLFRQKCLEHKIQDICANGFNNLVRIDVVNKIWYQNSDDPNISIIGLAEFSIFSPLTKISIDSQLLFDKMLFDSTVIHELGHAVLGLDHDDSKLAIMNSQVSNFYKNEALYNALIDNMFNDFVKSKGE